jgi:large subunit ribosomal protein L9
MDVILTGRVDQLGEAGDIVSVNRGYARNFLIPRGLAYVADDSHRRIMDEEARLAGLRSKKLKLVAEATAATYTDVSCTISVQANEEEQLYGSVSEREIATALQETGHEVDHKMVVLEEPIKQLGVYTVPIRLHEDVEVSVKVWVVKAED